METPSDRLKHARAEAGFASATVAAQSFGWNENTYRSHENGARAYKRPAADLYADAFGVTVQWLLLGESASSSELTRSPGKREAVIKFLPNGSAQITISRVVPKDVAVQIMGLLAETP